MQSQFAIAIGKLQRKPDSSDRDIIRMQSLKGNE